MAAKTMLSTAPMATVVPMALSTRAGKAQHPKPTTVARLQNSTEVTMRCGSAAAGRHARKTACSSTDANDEQQRDQMENIQARAGCQQDDRRDEHSGRKRHENVRAGAERSVVISSTAIANTPRTAKPARAGGIRGYSASSSRFMSSRTTCERSCFDNPASSALTSGTSRSASLRTTCPCVRQQPVT